MDSNTNGVYDGGTEYGIANVELQVTGLTVNGTSIEITVTTSITGYYVVENLVPGTYTVTAPSTASGALRATPSPLATTLTTSVTEDLDVDFAYYGFTGVNVVAFSATAEPDGQAIRVRWAVDGFGDVEGFLLYRATAPKGPYDQITPTPVRAVADGVCQYEYLDLQAKPGLSYWYKLQALPGGEWVGPIASASYYRSRLYMPLMSR